MTLGKIDPKRARELGIRADMQKHPTEELDYCGPSRVEVVRPQLMTARQHLWKEKDDGVGRRTP